MICPYCREDDNFTFYQSDIPNILSACPKSMLQHARTHVIRVNLCRRCGLGFNATPLDGEELKRIYDNYLYISPIHGIGHTKYSGMLDTIQKYCLQSEKIVEIGCSEGYLLHELRKQGYTNLTGIEPGPQAEEAEARGLHVLKGYFGPDTRDLDSVDAFIMMHVFEHFPNPFSILDHMLSRLSDNGKIIIEVPNFSGFHHQHLYYYTPFFIRRLSKDKELTLAYLKSSPDFLRFIVQKTNGGSREAGTDESIETVIARALKIQTEFLQKIRYIEQVLVQAGGQKIYWWGAGSASTILLNQIDKTILNQSEIVIIDGDTTKTGHFIPGVNYKIHDCRILNNSTVDTLIIASSFYPEIKNVMKNNNISAKSIGVVY